MQSLRCSLPCVLAEAFGVEPCEQLNLRPGYFDPFLRMPRDSEELEGLTAGFEVESGSSGLIPGWSKATRSLDGLTTPDRRRWPANHLSGTPGVMVNTASFLLQPSMNADWRTGKAVPTRIERADGEIIGIAGLRERWKNAGGEIVFSYTMLTINADDHAFMRDYPQRDHKKRMVVILPKGAYRDWLKAAPGKSMEFMRQYPAYRLSVSNHNDH